MSRCSARMRQLLAAMDLDDEERGEDGECINCALRMATALHFAAPLPTAVGDCGTKLSSLNPVAGPPTGAARIPCPSRPPPVRTPQHLPHVPTEGDSSPEIPSTVFTPSPPLETPIESLEAVARPSLSHLEAEERQSIVLNFRQERRVLRGLSPMRRALQRWALQRKAVWTVRRLTVERWERRETLARGETRHEEEVDWFHCSTLIVFLAEELQRRQLLWSASCDGALLIRGAVSVQEGIARLALWSSCTRAKIVAAELSTRYQLFREGAALALVAVAACQMLVHLPHAEAQRRQSLITEEATTGSRQRTLVGALLRTTWRREVEIDEAVRRAALVQAEQTARNAFVSARVPPKGLSC